MPPRRRALQAAAHIAAGAAIAGLLLPPGSERARAAQLDPRIIPTIHPTLTPASAIQVPMRIAADQTSVWQDAGEQRMLSRGHVYINVGYRQLRAESAAVWLTPNKESGESTYDVAIYLNGHVEVREGDQRTSTRTLGPELLVTTRISQSVLLTGTPTSEVAENDPLVKRGNELRQELLHRPIAEAHVPARIVVTTAEEALQSGWIARGPGNRIIAGPGDLQITRGANGEIIPQGPAGVAPPPPKPRPDAFIVGDIEAKQLDNESVLVIRNAYFFFDSRDGKPPVEFRAQRMVAFGPPPEKPATTQASGTQPATQPAAASAPAPADKNDLTKIITGAYMEGDVTVDQGEQLMVRAERVYYDTISRRAVMLDATLSTVDEVRNVPVYMRAAEIRQFSRGEFAARKVTFSTSEFYTPHYHIGASEVYLRDVTPQIEGPGGSAATGGAGGPAGIDLGLGGAGVGGGARRTYQMEAKDVTIDVQGTPIFYWPFLAMDTSKNDIPLRTIRISNNRTYGLSILTDWDLFGLAGQHEPEGVHADLNLDYFGKRGPAGGVQADWLTSDDKGLLRTYALMDQGSDRLGADLQDLPPQQDARGRATVRDMRDLGDGLTLSLEASYISDPTFLEQFFQREFDTDKEHETSIYLKKQGETDALTLLGKFNLFDFTATADQVDDQFSTEKKPEIKYWRLGDSFLDMFTYYSESGFANVKTNITDYTPAQLGLLPTFLGPPASVVPLNAKIRDYYRSIGWTEGDVVRGDTRHELDLPLQLGDVKVVPYVTGRVTAWDDAFPSSESGTTTRLWGSTGVRSSMEFWHVYNDVDSSFWDVHRLRHIIEPEFNAFVTASDQDRRDLQPFDRDVEGISGASGTELVVHQKWQTQRGGDGHWRTVDWLTLDVSWDQFYNKDRTGLFYLQDPVRGYYFVSRPELSQVQNSINVNGVWRAGERFRFIGETNYGTDSHHIEQYALGLAVDQSPSLSYFLGNRYVRALDTNEFTIAMDYELTKKYQLIAAESYDFSLNNNILTSFTLIRHLPRFNFAVTATYDANNADTTVSFMAWPEGFAEAGVGSRSGSGSGSSRATRGD